MSLFYEKVLEMRKKGRQLKANAVNVAETSKKTVKERTKAQKVNTFTPETKKPLKTEKKNAEMAVKDNDKQEEVESKS